MPKCPLTSTADIAVSFPHPGIIRLVSRSLFSDPDNPTCQRLLEHIFQSREITRVELRGGDAPHAELLYCPRTIELDDLVEEIAERIEIARPLSKQALPIAANVQEWGDLSSVEEPEPSPSNSLRISPSFTARDFRGVVRYHRHGLLVSGWEVISELPGRLRLRNLVLFRRSPLCRTLERELTSVQGIDRFKTSPVTGTVLLNHDPEHLTSGQIIEILDGVLARADQPASPDRPDMNLPACTASIPLAAAAQFAVPPLLPVAAVVFVYTSIPTLKEVRRVLLEEKRLGVDGSMQLWSPGVWAPCRFSRGRFAAGASASAERS